MEILGVEAVVDRVAASRAARPGGAIAFDGDGTLWSGDVGDDFVRAFFAVGRVQPPAASAMRALARAYQVPAPDLGAGLPMAIYDAYAEGRVPEELVCEMVTYACAGWTVGELAEFARAVVAEGGMAARVHGETARVVAWAASAGLEAFVVSASPVAVVVEAARALGFDAAHVIAATHVEADGVVCADVVRPIPYGEGKVTGLRARIGGRPLYAAFGDNVFDVPLLRSAEQGVAVRPKARLLARARDVPGLVELARAAP